MTTRNFGRVLRVEVVSDCVPSSPFTIPWISNAGVINMLRISSELSVICSASPLAAGLSVLEISQSSSSTKTADKPILAEKTHDASLCAKGPFILFQVLLAPVPKTFLLKKGSSSCLLFL